MLLSDRSIRVCLKCSDRDALGSYRAFRAAKAPFALPGFDLVRTRSAALGNKRRLRNSRALNPRRGNRRATRPYVCELHSAAVAVAAAARADRASSTDRSLPRPRAPFSREGVFAAACAPSPAHEASAALAQP